MFFVPVVLTNVLFLISAVVLGLQYARLARMEMPGKMRLPLMAFCIAMTLAATVYNAVNPWLSLTFFIVAVGCLVVTLRLRRYIPARRV